MQLNNIRPLALCLYLVISLLFSGNLIADGMYQMSVAGYWSDRYLFWLWFGATIFIGIYFWKSILTKIYMVILLIGLVLTIVPMMVPFFAIVLSSTGKGLLFKKQLTEKYRLQIVSYGIMSRSHLEIIENRGLFEKRIAKVNNDMETEDRIGFNIGEVKDAKLVQTLNNQLIIIFYGSNSRGELTIALKR